MTTRLKVAVAAVLLIVATLVGVIAWQQARIRTQAGQLAAAAAVQRVTLADGTARVDALVTQTGGAEQAAEQAGASLEQVRQDTVALGAHLNALVASTVRSAGLRRVGVASSASEPRGPTAALASDGAAGDDKWQYTQTKQTLRLVEPFKNGTQVPWGKAAFSAWQRNPWDVEVFERSYKSFAIGSVGPDGVRRVYTQFVIEVGGESFKLPVTEAQYVEDAVPARFRWRLKPMFAFGIAPFVRGNDGVAVLPGLQLAVAGYGSVPELPTWMFGAVGVSYEPRLQGAAVMIVPVSYNVGDPLPLLDNLYLGPAVGVQFGGGVSVGLALQVGL